MQLITITLTSIGTLLAIISTIYAIRFKRLEFNEKKYELARKEADEKAEKAREATLEEKLNTRNSILLKEIDVLKELLNTVQDSISEVNIRIDTTNARIDESNRNYENHVSESSRLSNFLRVYNYAMDQSLSFWYMDDERYRLLLKTWGDSVRKYISDYLDSKVNKIETVIVISMESKMETLIEEFLNLCNVIITDMVGTSTFRQWVITKNLHAKSKAFALDIDRNNMTSSQFDTKCASYIYNFSKEFIRYTADWLKEVKKKTA